MDNKVATPIHRDLEEIGKKIAVDPVLASNVAVETVYSRGGLSSGDGAPDERRGVAAGLALRMLFGNWGSLFGTGHMGIMEVGRIIREAQRIAGELSVDPGEFLDGFLDGLIHGIDGVSGDPGDRQPGGGSGGEGIDRELGGISGGVLHECLIGRNMPGISDMLSRIEVRPDPDLDGMYVWILDDEGCDISVGSRLEAVLMAAGDLVDLEPDPVFSADYGV